MSRKRPIAKPGKTESAPEQEVPPPCPLRLYVARPTPSSSRAENNLAAALAEGADGGARFQVEIIDVLKHPHQAARDRIIVTPCLVAAATHPQKTLVGDMSDTAALRLFLERALGGS